MTRKDMEAVIKDGGSVMVPGKIITKLEDLPLEEDLAQTDEEKAMVAADLRGQMEQLSERLAKIEGGPSGDDESGLLLQVQEGAVQNETLSKANDSLRSRVVYLEEQITVLLQERDSLVGQVSGLQKQIADYSAPNNSPEQVGEATGQPMEGAEVPPGQTGTFTTSTPLPADFPKRDALIAAGLDTVEAVAGKTVEQLADVVRVSVGVAKAIKTAADQVGQG